VGILPTPEITSRPELGPGETVETKVFINSAVIGFDFGDLNPVIAFVTVKNVDGTSYNKTVQTPNEMVFHQNCSVTSIFSKLHHQDSTSQTFKVHVVTFNEDPIIATQVSETEPEFDKTVYAVEIVVIVLGLALLVTLIGTLIGVFIMKKRRDSKKRKQIQQFDTHFTRMEQCEFKENQEEIFGDDEIQLLE